MLTYFLDFPLLSFLFSWSWSGWQQKYKRYCVFSPYFKRRLLLGNYLCLSIDKSSMWWMAVKKTAAHRPEKDCNGLWDTMAAALLSPRGVNVSPSHYRSICFFWQTLTSKSWHHNLFSTRALRNRREVFCVLFALLKVYITLSVADVCRHSPRPSKRDLRLLSTTLWFFLISAYFSHLWPLHASGHFYISEFDQAVLLQPESHRCRCSVVVQTCNVVPGGRSCVLFSICFKRATSFDSKMWAIKF